MRVSSLLAGTAIAFASTAHALPKVVRAGKYLYQEDGTRFFMKGVAYQEQGVVTTDDEFQDNFIDPLATPEYCSRDLPYLTQLGVNSVRVYSVDPRNNHDECMRMFNDAGIYTIIDLSQPLNGSIDREAPRWSSNLMNLYLQTVDTFSKYENVLAYTVGNEIVRDVPSSASAPFIKAAVRDVKAYIKSKGYSQLVTYATTDGSGWRNPLVTYLTCGDEATTVDMIGLNNYQWKGDSSIAAYGATNTFFQTINVPAYFSEYGSPASPPRLFTEVDALFGEEMSAIWSGGLAFAYFQSIQQGFGLVDLSADAKTVTPNADFTALQTHYQAVTFATTPSQADAGTTQYPACPTPDATVFVGSANLPPTPNQSACDCAVNEAFPCVFSPRTVNTSAVIGPLFNFACEELGTKGSNACEALSADGTTGTYGIMSTCDPSSQLSYVFSAFYESNSQDAASCSFNGNATLNKNAPTTAEAASKAAESCLANARNVYTPTGPSVPGSTTSGGAKPTGTNAGGNGNGGSDSAMRSSYSFVAVGVSMASAFIGALTVL